MAEGERSDKREAEVAPREHERTELGGGQVGGVAGLVLQLQQLVGNRAVQRWVDDRASSSGGAAAGAAGAGSSTTETTSRTNATGVSEGTGPGEPSAVETGSDVLGGPVTGTVGSASVGAGGETVSTEVGAIHTYEFMGAVATMAEGHAQAELPRAYLSRLDTTAAGFTGPPAVPEGATRVVHQVYSHRATRDGPVIGTVDLYYAEYAREEEVYSSTISVDVNGVAVPVLGATETELADLRAVLGRVPGPHLQLCVQSRPVGFVFADWTGSIAESTTYHRLSGGGNLPAGRAGTRPARGATPEVTGARIELTHATAAEGQDRIALTILHEVAHGIQAGDRGSRLVPATVHREYGSSVHQGPNEQPAYAYMRYLLGQELHPEDRAFFDASFDRDGHARPTR